MSTRKILLLLLLISCNSGVSSQDKTIPNTNKHIVYQGRVHHTENYSKLFWSGTSITVKFKGSEISAVFSDENGQNYYNIIIDGELSHYIKLNKDKKEYLLCNELTDTIHTITIFRRTEFIKGTTKFFGFKIKNESEIYEITDKTKFSIEFIGDSVTSGFAIGNDSRKDSTYTNNYNSYAYKTAKYFNANYSCIAVNGIGFIISWFPKIIYDILYNTDPNNPDIKWNFKENQKDIIVVNLGQNDYWLLKSKNSKEYKNKFKNISPDSNYIINEYTNLLMSIRELYPNAHIIAMLGNMSVSSSKSPWSGYIKTAVKNTNDEKCYSLIVPYKKTKGHPNNIETDKLSGYLINFIEKNIIDKLQKTQLN